MWGGNKGVRSLSWCDWPRRKEDSEKTDQKREHESDESHEWCMQVFGCSDEQTAANQRAKLKGAFYSFGAVARALLCTVETTAFLLLVSSVVWISETGNEDLRPRNHTKLAKKNPHPLALLATSPEERMTGTPLPLALLAISPEERMFAPSSP